MDIGAVVVTYNRLEKLKKTLNKFSDMTQMPKYLLVVDNNSNDGTWEYLAEWQKSDGDFKKIVVHMDRNTGGSGGFYEGLKQSLDLNADWVWVSDDDAYPASDAFEKASAYLEKHRNDKISAICAKVIRNGVLDESHFKKYEKHGIIIKEIIADKREFDKDEFDINTLTYVGAIMNKEALKAVGITNKDYFIYWDDLEHGLRLSKYGRIICIPSICVYHEVGEDRRGLTWRLYYSYRNMTDTYRKHFPGVCFAFYSLKVKVKVLYNHFTGRRNIKLNMLEEAYSNAVNGKFGLHEIYRPGWKPKKNNSDI